MVRIPYHLNTKEDVLTCHSLALAGELDGAQLKQKLQNLLSDEKVWSFKSVVSSTYAAGANEKVMTEQDAGQEKHVLYELKSNPNARFLVMGFQKAELQSLIDQL